MVDRDSQGQGEPYTFKPAKPSQLVPFMELQFFDCRVERVGPGEDGTVYVNLTDTGGEFTAVWFKALRDIEQQVLETALAAVQGNLTCQVALTGTSDQSEIYRIHAIASSGQNI